jgi:hypothetical protein
MFRDTIIRLSACGNLIITQAPKRGCTARIARDEKHGNFLLRGVNKFFG